MVNKDSKTIESNNTSYKSIIAMMVSLAVPTVMEQILSTLLQYVDTAMVGRLGEDATAAVSVTTTITWLVNSVPFAIAAAALTLVAQAVGARDDKQVKKLSMQAVFLGIIIATIIETLSIVLSPMIPIWMGAEERIIHPASLYFTIISIPLVVRVIGTIMGYCIRACGDTRTPMIISVGTNVLNIVLNMVFIYGLRLGVTGAAIATAIAYSLSGFAMMYIFFKNRMLSWKTTEFTIDTAMMSKVWGLGFPVLLTNVTSCAGYVVFAGLVSSMGTTIFAAHSIAVTAETLFYIPGYGLRTATSTMIGYAVGERNQTRLKKVSRISVAITVGMMILSGIILFFVAYPLMSLFTPVEKVASLGAGMLKLVAFSEPFFGLMIVLEGIYYGMGETRHAFVIETASMWGIRILFTFLCVKVWHLGLTEVWLCMIADNVCKALLFVLFAKKLIVIKDKADHI